MKSTGIVRKVDQLGRVVIPRELRRNLDIEVGAPLEIYMDGEQIILKKYAPGCVFCGECDTKMTRLAERNICSKCHEKIKNKYSY